MIKTIVLVRGVGEETYETFHERIREKIERVSEQINPEKISYTITLEKPPAMSIIPFKKSKIAVISIYTDKPLQCDEMKKCDGFAGSFRATEAFPVAYEKTWPNGEPTPGICLLTLFRKKKSISYEKFIDRWHNGHSPLTLKVHPVYHYSRNVVEKTLGEAALHYDGIVEEHSRERSQLLNPFIFFGGPLMTPVNMIRVYFDVKSFLDYGSIESYLVREYQLK
jgi:hypothetical protein